ncbi:MAG: hypothetical protein ABJH45_04105 [Paracoccaceae bacterium]
MTLDIAIRWTEVLLAFAIFQQSVEHLTAIRSERNLVAMRIPIALVLLSGFASSYAVWILTGMSVLLLRRFDGPYNGGADKMSLLILTCLSLVHLAPSLFWAEMAMAYLAIQVVLSYFVSVGSNYKTPIGETEQPCVMFSGFPLIPSQRICVDCPTPLALRLLHPGPQSRLRSPFHWRCHRLSSYLQLLQRPPCFIWPMLLCLA